jgi:hypothetical protein
MRPCVENFELNQYYVERYIRGPEFSNPNYPRLLWINLLKNPPVRARGRKTVGFLDFA